MIERIDPVHKTGAGEWYFYDETWSSAVGPFKTEEKARGALAKYCEELNYEDPE